MPSPFVSCKNSLYPRTGNSPQQRTHQAVRCLLSVAAKIADREVAMDTIAIFQQAVAMHQAGQIDEAVEHYR